MSTSRLCSGLLSFPRESYWIFPPLHQTIYTIKAASGSKVFEATRLANSSDSTDPTPAVTSVKPEKISRAGGFIYKASFPHPHLEGTRCVWKGSIFQSVELYTKDSAGQRTPVALYIRSEWIVSLEFLLPVRTG